MFLILAVILYQLTLSKCDSKSENQLPLVHWEVIGPLPVGKLELDGDPTFQAYNEIKELSENDENDKIRNAFREDDRSNRFDVAVYILSMHKKRATVLRFKARVKARVRIRVSIHSNLVVIHPVHYHYQP
jgi:hypothetical protein